MTLAETDICRLVLGGLYEERQFIIVPGDYNITATTKGNFWTECNKGTPVHVFDTYDWEFKPEFDPENKGSKVPPTISDLVGGSDAGGATLKQPKAGWSDQVLGTTFSIRNQLAPQEEFQFPHTTSSTVSSTTSSTTPSTTSSTTSSPQASSWGETKPNKNAIIGGVVGGVCVVTLAAGALIFSVNRYRKPSQPQAVEISGENFRSELNGQSSNAQKPSQPQAVEISGENFRSELHGQSSNAQWFHELHAYEPPELSGGQ